MEMQENHISIGVLKWWNLSLLTFHKSCANKVMPRNLSLIHATDSIVITLLQIILRAQKCLLKI
uniref:Uncharacterized protein n=1 Tax=Cucumis melo TaxID=3656 RepID=A0A9I9EL85_CUCME